MRRKFCTPGLVMLGITLVLQGCAPSLGALTPTRSPHLAEAPRRTLTVMPIALSMVAEEFSGGPITPAASAEAAARAVPLIAMTTQRQVARGGWRFEELSWDGTAAAPPAGPRQPGTARRQVIDPMGVANLTDWLFGYGDGVLRHSPAPEVVPPVPLDTDATLFVGGHGYLHEDRPLRSKVAATVGTVIGVVLAVAVLVAVIAVLAVGGARGGFGGLPFPRIGSLGGSGVGGGLARAAVLPLRLGAQFAVPVARTALTLGTRLPTGHVDGRGCNPYVGVHDGVAYKRDGDEPPPLPSSEARANTLALSAVLVENRTGRVLWSAGQVMEVDPVDGYEVRKAVEHLLADLPRSEAMQLALR